MPRRAPVGPHGPQKFVCHSARVGDRPLENGANWFPCELPGTDRQDKLGNFKKLPKFFYVFGKRNADVAGNSFAEWAILKISWKRKKIPAPKMNHGHRKTKWKIFKNHRCAKKK